MSGGVDSSVAASLLQEGGFEVVGSMMRFWPDERPAGAFDLCCSPNAAYDARRVADAIDVPFYLLDYRDKFADVVIDPFVPTYEAGETPNPCVWCNRDIKFGAFLQKAKMLGSDFIATGHYVRRVDGPNGVELHRGRGRQQGPDLLSLGAAPRDFCITCSSRWAISPKTRCVSLPRRAALPPPIKLRRTGSVLSPHR